MRRLCEPFLRLAAAAAVLLSAIFYNDLSLMPDARPELVAYAMPDGTLPTICGVGGAEHKPTPGLPHCSACLVAMSPGVLVSRLAVGLSSTLPIAAAEVPAGLSLPQGPIWPPQHARAPPVAFFA